MFFQEAVEYFTGRGFEVKPGPKQNEVTLINDRRPDFCQYAVVPTNRLIGMAKISRETSAAVQMASAASLVA